jgi:BirA family biotin operon repressor/biotin-[acetyl-CoA-carboxylase] ligase
MKLDEIKTELNTSILGKEIIYYSETTSTNDIAIELAENGAVEGTLVIADSQSMGRGRRGRKWLAPPETCILASIILRPSLPLRQISIITPIAVTSVVKAIHSVTKLNASIKWPNDVIIMDRKVSGVLTEMRIERRAISFIVVGIGVNVNVSRDSFPLEISDIATSLSIESGHEVSRIHLLQEILRHFENRYLRLNDDTFSEFLDEWKSLSVTIGKRIQIESADDTKRGVALDIDEVGALIIQLDNGKIKKIANDDLVKVRAI